MAGPDPRKEEPAVPGGRQRDDGRRRRQLVEAAAVAGEITAALIADSRHLIGRSNDLIARPHMIVKSSVDAAPPTRQAIVCERCGLGITTPGVAIVRGCNVMHVRCDA
jgi:hypothetical protein